MRKKSVFREYLESFAFAVVVALLIRTFIVQPFKIPSSSMVPTLLVGDHILVNKFLYGTKLPFSPARFLRWREPSRGDVVVFKYPKDHSVDFIKRLVGLPGERLDICPKRILLDGTPLNDGWGHYELDEGGFLLEGTFAAADCVPLVVPSKGMGVEYTASQVRVNQEALSDQGSRFVREAIAVEETDAGTAVVTEDHYFMMGDNRNNSRDSRAWGFVKNREVEGKAFLIYWSWDKEKKRVRWDRIGNRIR
ncbi:MAG: signal peptidase I [Nitrospirae bacterium]|nr:signal peptidase I [Nitrospirota bacterium]